MSEDKTSSSKEIIYAIIGIILLYFYYAYFIRVKEPVKKIKDEYVGEVTKHIEDEYGISLLKKANQDFFKAFLENDNFDSIKYGRADFNLDYIEDINYQAPNGNTLLIAWSKKNFKQPLTGSDTIFFKKEFEKIISRKPNINLTDVQNKTALIWNIIMGCESRTSTSFAFSLYRNKLSFDHHYYMAKRLLDLEAAKKNAFSYAKFYNSPKYIKLLIKYGSPNNLSSTEKNRRHID